MAKNQTLAAFQAADLFADAANHAAAMLRAAASAEADPDIASELQARASILGLTSGLMSFADDEDPHIAMWCLRVAGRLMTNPERLAELEPDVLPAPPAPDHAAAQV